MPPDQAKRGVARDPEQERRFLRLLDLGALAIILVEPLARMGEHLLDRQAGYLVPAGWSEVPGFLVEHLLVSALLALGWLAWLRPRISRILADSRQRRLALEEAARRSRIDALTGLPNRLGLQEYLNQLWAGADDGARSVAICHLDLTGLKSVNDRSGFHVGDRVLVRVAELLRHETRGDDFVARVGGDAFVVVLADVLSREIGESVARRILQRLRDPIHLGEERVQLDASIGWTLARCGEDDPAAALAAADMALNAVRRGPGRGIAEYTAELRAQSVARARLRDELSQALAEDRFEPFFQPQIELISGAVTGFEVLMRWIHPARGPVAPGAFMEVAEENGLIVPIGRRVIVRALEALRGWRAAGLGGFEIGLNLSAAELADRRFVDWLKWEVEMRDLPPELIRIELLETVLIHQADDALAANMAALAAHGFGVDLDDFGTGRSSLSNLLFLSVDRLKIDRSFIRNIDATPRQQQMVGAMVAMARGLGLEVLAEGVERAEEAEVVRRLGCRYGQGFWFGHPMPAAELPGWLAARGHVAERRAQAG